MCQEIDSLIWITNEGGEIVRGQINHVRVIWVRVNSLKFYASEGLQ